MNMNLEEQEDELLALESIFDSDEFVRNEFSGEIRVSPDLPVDFNVVLKHGETQRQYVISFLPPLLLTFELPVDYPSSSPPSFTLTCTWLTPSQLASLKARLIELHQATGGAVVLFSWIQFLREDALKLLNIQNLLELPSDQISSVPEKRDQRDPEPEDNYTQKSEPTDVSDLCGPADCILVNSSAAAKSADTHGADRNDLTSPFIQSSLNSEFTDPKALTSNDLSKSELLPSVESVQISQEDGSASASSSSNLQGPSEATPRPVQPKAISLNSGDIVSGISLTPSQKLLSQILIYNAEQKRRAFATTVFACGVCYTDWLGSECVQLFECGHVFCRACLGDFCKVRIAEGNVRGVACPEVGCSATPTPAQVNNLVGEELFSRYDRLLLQSTLDHMSDVMYCPRSSCASPVISEKSSGVAICSVCSFAFCVDCKKTYHGSNKCYEDKSKTKVEDFLNFPQTEEGMKALLDDYSSGSKERRRLLKSRYGRKILDGLESNLNEKWKSENTKACPHCFSPIQKDGGCNFMQCTWCQHPFYWTD
ncbi:E3 ubiquitin-protein ligase RNF14 [Austrofundulus limnaeus]|uniref:RBR-type E3 ubiquitin transferase n=1 Tax=Austrofundulus limnaeus TaxID=52670 RepID=A0A2I4CKD1_AUSLI|nr:PREDICTED: E3 ubiquitin-protein ligase RNF14-like [Austrofundulus limnaeus]